VSADPLTLTTPRAYQIPLTLSEILPLSFIDATIKLVLEETKSYKDQNHLYAKHALCFSGGDEPAEIDGHG
jgi:hypothetical protein